MDVKKTLRMPQTPFEMRGNLPLKEPKQLEEWESQKIYEKLLSSRKDMPEYVLHDGPPYANGDVHCGHLLNRLLKDFTVRYHALKGERTPFIFGWDTHGLPIEVQVSKNGIDRHKLGVVAFRKECEKYALTQVEKQKSQIKRFGLLGDFENPYLTLRPEYEAAQVELFAEMALQGLIYKGLKPVYWSPSSESALAEAEVEYRDVEARTLYVAFPFAEDAPAIFKGAATLIWTTTPWTIPADLAVTLNPDFTYGLFKTDRGNFLFLASLKETLEKEIGFHVETCLQSFKGRELENLLLVHPLYPTKRSPIILADFVTDDSGTGCVHTAPDHGTDDFNACQKYGIKPFGPVDAHGVLHLEKGDPLDGLFYEEANDRASEILEKKGYVLKEKKIVHSYPHDWRTHKPVIFRATEQWFCSIAPIREKLLKAIGEVEWNPSWGRVKMENMVKDRTDWCISRQRSWGVPLPIFYGEDGTPLLERELFEHVAKLFREHGSSIWFSKEAKELLPENYHSPHSPHDIYSKENDIMDVWFDSGSSFHAVIEARGLHYPADLYLEGNDQYRGWFNSSLILAVARDGRAPFKKCLTHGWVMDEKWEKMSKSKGNGIDPLKVAEATGADVLRLWAAGVNYMSDVRLSEDIIKTCQEQYRKIRNTFRFLLANMKYHPEQLNYRTVDRWILNSLEEVKASVYESYEHFAYPSALMTLMNFLSNLSSFYLDFAKDILYCESEHSERRKAVTMVFYQLGHELALLFTPFIPFTMEEVYRYMPGPKKESIQLEVFTAPQAKEEDKEQKSFFASRDLLLKALEEVRAQGLIGSSSEAAVTMKLDDNEANRALLKLLEKEEKSEVLRLYGVADIHFELGKEERVEVKRSDFRRCERCRQLRDDVEELEDGVLCKRCQEVLGEIDGD